LCPQAKEAARQFNESWPCELQLLANDCHHHTTALVQHLTGRAVSIQQLLPLRRPAWWM